MRQNLLKWAKNPPIAPQIGPITFAGRAIELPYGKTKSSAKLNYPSNKKSSSVHITESSG